MTVPLSLTAIAVFLSHGRLSRPGPDDGQVTGQERSVAAANSTADRTVADCRVRQGEVRLQRRRHGPKATNQQVPGRETGWLPARVRKPMPATASLSRCLVDPLRHGIPRL